MQKKKVTRFENAWRAFIWVFTAATLFPWWWLGIWTRLNGGRPGNEGEGMGGFLMMLFLGLPSLVLALFTEVRLLRKRDKNK